MAASWIKLKQSLRTSPKLIAATCYLCEQAEFRDWYNAGHGLPKSQPLSRFVTKQFVTRVTLVGVCEVWQEINGVIGEDCHLPYMTVEQLEIMTDIPCLGAAMLHVGWIEEHPDGGLIFPNFYEFNTPEKSRPAAMTPAERQQKRRDKIAREQSEQAHSVTKSSRNRHGDVTESHEMSQGEEKSREEKKYPSPPSPSVENRSANPVQAAAEELISCGVQFPRSAVETAFANGATLPDLQALCQHYKSMPGAWDAGALQRRVKGFVRGQPVSEGWPQPDKKFERDQNLSEQRVHAAQQAREREMARIRDKTVREDRRNRHGPYVARLNRAELFSLIRDLFPDESVRESLLRQLRKDEHAFRQSASQLDLIYQRLDQNEKEHAA